MAKLIQVKSATSVVDAATATAVIQSAINVILLDSLNVRSSVCCSDYIITIAYDSSDVALFCASCVVQYDTVAP